MQFRQRVRYVKTVDGTRMAWAEAGSGPTLVKAANWLTHLEYEWDSPVWKHWIRFLSGNFRYVRYDERGCGMSEWRASHLTLDDWTHDLATVIEAAQPEYPITLLGISQGSAACVRYAVEHPERVGKLILYGSYVHGVYKRNLPEAETKYRAMIELARVAWAQDNPVFRQLFTSRFIPGGTPEQLGWFNELCLRCTTGPVAAELLDARGGIDITDLLPRVRTPTLVLHARNDDIVPLSEGHLLASGIAGAEFVELDSRNHVLLEHEPAWQRFCEAVLAFAKPAAAADGDAFEALSAREREVLALMCDGLSNARIAETLAIGDKTVRNHASNLFDKLGVRSRAQAIVFAHEHGFSGKR